MRTGPAASCRRHGDAPGPGSGGWRRDSSACAPRTCFEIRTHRAPVSMQRQSLHLAVKAIVAQAVDSRPSGMILGIEIIFIAGPRAIRALAGEEVFGSFAYLGIVLKSSSLEAVKRL